MIGNITHGIVTHGVRKPIQGKDGLLDPTDRTVPSWSLQNRDWRVRKRFRWLPRHWRLPWNDPAQRPPPECPGSAPRPPPSGPGPRPLGPCHLAPVAFPLFFGEPPRQKANPRPPNH